MLSNAFNTLAKAKLVYNKKRELYKLVVAFNVHTKQKENGEIVHIFPTQAKCAYVSGDISLEDVNNTLVRAASAIRSSNIQLVD